MLANTQETPPGMLSRDEAATRLGVTPQELRRRQRTGQLKPAKRGDRGKVYYRVQDIEALVATMRDKPDGNMMTPGMAAISYTGEQASMVFAALREGKSIDECIIDLKIIPAIVKALALEYASIKGALFLPGDVVTAINRLPLDGPMPITKAEEVLAVLTRAADPKCVECDKRYPILCKHCVNSAINRRLLQKENL
jgi:hypothetical protein